MSVSPVLDESIFEKLNPVPRIENLENFPFSEMKGPNNVSVRLDLFPEHKTNSTKMEFNAEEKSKNDDNEISKWNETEQLNSQVVFINPEWDEIEEEKAGISSFLNSITPNISSDKVIPSQVTEFVVTDTESVSSVTVSLDEFAEDSEEIVAVISDSEAEVIQAEFLTQMDSCSERKSPKKMLESFPGEEVNASNWKETDNLKSPIDNDPTVNVSLTEKDRPSQNAKKHGVELIETSRLLKASCYVMQNGKITKPFYIVKNPVLREDSMYKNINKSDDLLAKKALKNLNATCGNEQERNLLPLGKSTLRKKENLREPQLTKLGRNQELIRIIENPARAKKVVVNKVNDKGPQDSNSKKPSVENGGIFGKNLSASSNSCESEDLMWLLDFKLDNLFSESSLPALFQLDDSLEQYTEFPGKFVDVEGSISNFNKSDVDDKARVEIGCQTETTTTRPHKPQNNKFGMGKQHHKMETKSESTVSGRTFNDLKCSENRKPPFTYTELIECALQEKGPLTVSEIYNWISDSERVLCQRTALVGTVDLRNKFQESMENKKSDFAIRGRGSDTGWHEGETFPYYKSWDDRWKNSVRHNLSINPYFRKGTKARQGSGHLWTVNKSEDNSKINSWKRHRFHEFEEFSKRLRYNGGVEKQEESNESVPSSRVIDETELATASIEDKENRRLHRDVLMAACVDNNFISTTNVSLEQSAEEILSGVKKNVEVQYLEPVKSPCENDFLNPISKEILMGECGLLNQIELNLTAETGEHLSIVDGMADSEHIFGIPDEFNFHYDISSHTPQLLPLAK